VDLSIALPWQTQNILSLVGRDREQDLLGKKVLEALPEIASQGFNELLDQVYESGEPYFGNERLVSLARGVAGELEDVYLNFVYQPWRKADGTIEGVFVHAVDVTESVMARRAVEELALSVQQNEARLRAVLQQVVSGICQVNRDGAFEFVNDRFCEIAGRTMDMLRKLHFDDLVHHDDRRQSRQVFETLYRGQPAMELIQWWTRSNGTEVWVQLNLSPVFNEHGSVESVVCVTQDITAKKQAEEALRRSEKLAAVGQLASTIAHEINNPLESVTNLLYLMQTTASADELKGYAKLATDELMRVSHVVASTLRFHRQPTTLALDHVSGLLDSARTIYQARLRSSEIEVVRQYTDEEPIYCSNAELRQVFTNIIGNAFNAMRNSARRTLFLRARPSTSWNMRGHGLRVTIADTGRGMKPCGVEACFRALFHNKGDEWLRAWTMAEPGYS
jgi:PAS domain S-box-containing protein